MASHRFKERRLALLVLMCASLALACGGSGMSSGGKEKNSASAVLVVKCELKDAEVWINSRYSRSAGEFARGLRLRPGDYRVEVRRSGYHSMYYDLSLAKEERHTLKVALARKFR